MIILVNGSVVLKSDIRQGHDKFVFFLFIVRILFSMGFSVISIDISTVEVIVTTLVIVRFFVWVVVAIPKSDIYRSAYNTRNLLRLSVILLS